VGEREREKESVEGGEYRIFEGEEYRIFSQLYTCITEGLFLLLFTSIYVHIRAYTCTYVHQSPLHY
jgi:hypothetical protein